MYHESRRSHADIYHMYMSNSGNESVYVDYVVLLSASSWCDYDTGYATITDGRGHPHHVYISVTRDGSVWLRAGVEHKSVEWVFTREYRQSYSTKLLSTEAVNILKSLNHTDTCVLTDLLFELRMDNGWHPSFVKTYNVFANTNDILVFKHSKNCQMNTTLSMTETKQQLICSGGIINACGLHNLPAKNQFADGTTFISSVTFDPEGLGSVTCQQPPSRNSFTFIGSYYHVYAKLASCPAPRGTCISRTNDIRPYMQLIA